MKRYKILIMIAVLVMAAYAFATSAFDIPWGSQETYSNLTGNKLRAWAEGMEGRVGTNLGTGHIFYVDSDVLSEGDGSSWINAKNTLDEAISLCTNDRGDVVYVAQGHNEGLSAADGVDCDISGITIIGCGKGSLKPTFDFDAATAGMFTVGAAQVTCYNLRFRASVTDGNGVMIQATGDEFEFVDCDWVSETPGTDEFVDCIKITAAGNDGLIKRCTVRMGAGAAVNAILLNGAVVGVTIEDNTIWGDFSTACIKGQTTASDDVIIRNNTLFNGTMGGDNEINTKPAIELVDATGGLIANNVIISDVATALLMIVADDCVRMHNVVSDTDGDEFSGSFEDAANYSEDPNSVAGHKDG